MNKRIFILILFSINNFMISIFVTHNDKFGFIEFIWLMSVYLYFLYCLGSSEIFLLSKQNLKTSAVIYIGISLIVMILTFYSASLSIFSFYRMGISGSLLITEIFQILFFKRLQMKVIIFEKSSDYKLNYEIKKDINVDDLKKLNEFTKMLYYALFGVPMLVLFKSLVVVRIIILCIEIILYILFLLKTYQKYFMFFLKKESIKNRIFVSVIFSFLGILLLCYERFIVYSGSGSLDIVTTIFFPAILFYPIFYNDKIISDYCYKNS